MRMLFFIHDPRHLFVEHKRDRVIVMDVPNAPPYIIIRGPLGIGKSTIAKKLATRLRAVRISLDDVLAERGLDSVDPGEGCIPAKNFITAQEAILPEVRAHLHNGRIVIFDGCFYHPETIDHLTASLDPFPSIIFTLKAPLETCIERDRTREPPLGEEATRAVHALVSRFDHGTVIDATQPIDAIITAMMQKIEE
jgi:predicted kinase